VLAVDDLAVAHVTLHGRATSSHLSREAILDKVHVLDGLTVCWAVGRGWPWRALNPHASDGGLFGDEESG
jgi:4-hydroxy-L-threonine phosphate dehydrogenase PdxA